MLPKAEKIIIPGTEVVGKIKSFSTEKKFGWIQLTAQQNDIYFAPWDLVEALKKEFDSRGPEGCGLVEGAAVHLWLQQMPGGDNARLRARDVSLSPGSTPSDAETVANAIS